MPKNIAGNIKMDLINSLSNIIYHLKGQQITNELDTPNRKQNSPYRQQNPEHN